jgi:hypothetical protein
VSQKPIILLPLQQVEQFLATINENLGTQLTIPRAAESTGFLIQFEVDGTPRPRYLGRSISRDMADDLKKAVPDPSYRPHGIIEQHVDPSDRSLQAFKRSMDRVLEIDKKKKKVSKDKKNQERHAKQQSWNSSSKRIQQYLGLKQVNNSGGADISASLQGLNLQWGEYAEATQEATSERVCTLDCGKPAPHQQEGSVVFICVDVESYERDHNLITEIGIATLDTADIKTLAPVENGTAWRKAIRARHFRIREYGHLHNSEFIQGCADKFEFGESEWISIKEAPRIIASCFREPFSAMSGIETGQLRTEKSNGPASPTENTLKRNIVLVGHDTQTDVKYLRKLGYDPYNLSNLLETCDTALMYRALHHEPNSRSLGHILYELGITGWYLHNAGNDAVYTLQAMLGLAIKGVEFKLDREAKEALKLAHISQ